MLRLLVTAVQTGNASIQAQMNSYVVISDSSWSSTSNICKTEKDSKCIDDNLKEKDYIYLFFLLLNSVYTVLPLRQGLDRVKGGTIHMKTVKYVQICA